MRFVFAFLFLLIFPFLSAFSCDCKYITKNENFEHVDYVFLGKISKVYKEYYEISLIESFKKEVPLNLTGKSDSCSISPDEGEIWLLYANRIGKRKVFISQCSWSRNFEFPYCIYSEGTPPPRPPTANRDFLHLEELQFKNMALNELYFDIFSLRSKKIKSELDNINSKVNYWNLTLLILFIIVIIYLRKITNFM